MKAYSVDMVSYEQLVTALRKEFSMYGDLLQFLTIKPYDLPSEFSASIISVASLFDSLMKLYGNLLESYLALALIRKGYVDKYLQEELAPEEMESFYLDNSNNEHSEPIGFLRFKGDQEEILIHIIYVKPMFWNGSDLGFFLESTLDNFIEEQQKASENELFKKTSQYVIPDPFLYRLFRDKLQKAKEKVESELSGWIFCSADEFIDKYLSDQQSDYKEEFKGIIQFAKKNLEKEFPFLSIAKHLSGISNARNEIKEAIYKSIDLNHNDPSELIRKATKGVEGLLLAIYWKTFNAEPDRIEFNFMLSKLKEVLEEEYGRDIYLDLEFLHRERNFSSHTGHPEPGPYEMMKVIQRSKLFLDLFNKKFGYSD